MTFNWELNKDAPCQLGCSICICPQGVQQSDMDVQVVDLNVNRLLYTAADAVLIASSECELQALIITLKEECENNDLSLNSSKTNVVFETYLKLMKKGWNAR